MSTKKVPTLPPKKRTYDMSKFQADTNTVQSTTITTLLAYPLQDASAVGLVKRRKRHYFTKEEQKVLEETFARTAYPVLADIIRLSAQLNLAEATVKTWFQNKRVKWKKRLKTTSTLQSEIGDDVLTSRYDDGVRSVDSADQSQTSCLAESACYDPQHGSSVINPDTTNPEVFTASYRAVNKVPRMSRKKCEHPVVQRDKLCGGVSVRNARQYAHSLKSGQSVKQDQQQRTFAHASVSTCCSDKDSPGTFEAKNRISAIDEMCGFISAEDTTLRSCSQFSYQVEQSYPILTNFLGSNITENETLFTRPCCSSDCEYLNSGSVLSGLTNVGDSEVLRAEIERAVASTCEQAVHASSQQESSPRTKEGNGSVTYLQDCFCVGDINVIDTHSILDQRISADKTLYSDEVEGLHETTECVDSLKDSIRSGKNAHNNDQIRKLQGVASDFLTDSVTDDSRYFLQRTDCSNISLIPEDINNYFQRKNFRDTNSNATEDTDNLCQGKVSGDKERNVTENIETLFQRSGGRDMDRNVTENIATSFRRSGDRDMDRNVSENVETLFQRNGDKDKDRNVTKNIETLFQRSGDKDKDRNVTENIETLFQRRGDRDMDRNVTENIETLFQRSCGRDMDRNVSENVETLFQKSGDKNKDRNVAVNIETLFQRSGDKDKDRNVTENIETLFQRSGDRDMDRNVSENIETSFHRSGSRDMNRNVCENVETLFQRSGDKDKDRNVTENIEILFQRSGDKDKDSNVTENIETLIQRSGDRDMDSNVSENVETSFQRRGDRVMDRNDTQNVDFFLQNRDLVTEEADNVLPGNCQMIKKCNKMLEGRNQMTEDNNNSLPWRSCITHGSESLLQSRDAVNNIAEGVCCRSTRTTLIGNVNQRNFSQNDFYTVSNSHSPFINTNISMNAFSHMIYQHEMNSSFNILCRSGQFMWASYLLELNDQSSLSNMCKPSAVTLNVLPVDSSFSSRSQQTHNSRNFSHLPQAAAPVVPHVTHFVENASSISHQQAVASNMLPLVQHTSMTFNMYDASPIVQQADSRVCNISPMSVVYNTSSRMQQSTLNVCNENNLLSLVEYPAADFYNTSTVQWPTSSVYNTSPSVQQATSSVYNTSPIVQQATSSVYNTSPIVQLATSSVYNTSPIVQQATSSVYNTSPIVQLATSSVYNISPNVQQATSTTYSTLPVVQQATSRAYNTSPNVQHSASSAYNTSPSVQQKSSSLYNTSPIVHQATSSVYTPSLVQQTTSSAYNISPIVQESTSSAYNISPVVQETTSSAYNISPIVRETTSSVYSTSPIVQQAISRVCNTSPSMQQTACSVYNTLTNVQQTASGVCNTSSMVLQTFPSMCNTSSMIQQVNYSKYSNTSSIMHLATSGMHNVSSRLQGTSFTVAVTNAYSTLPALQETFPEVYTSSARGQHTSGFTNTSHMLQQASEMCTSIPSLCERDITTFKEQQTSSTSYYSCSTPERSTTYFLTEEHPSSVNVTVQPGISSPCNVFPGTQMPEEISSAQPKSHLYTTKLPSFCNTFFANVNCKTSTTSAKPSFNKPSIVTLSTLKKSDIPRTGQLFENLSYERNSLSPCITPPSFDFFNDYIGTVVQVDSPCKVTDFLLTENDDISKQEFRYCSHYSHRPVLDTHPRTQHVIIAEKECEMSDENDDDDKRIGNI